jgi:teichuronic acid biosynthesis glycosyltransferase TuaH
MTDDSLLVYLAGTSWSGIPGTDRQLAVRLGERTPVLWVDPPVSVLAVVRDRLHRKEVPPFGLSEVSPGVKRLRVLAPPGVTRPGVRTVARGWQQARLRAAVRRLGLGVRGVVLAHPQGRFPGLGGQRVLYVTDDWPAGAALMGLDPEQVTRTLKRNVAAAHVVAAVSVPLLERLMSWAEEGPARGRGDRPATLLLPNGCEPGSVTASERPSDVPAEAFALLVGQLNERLDVDALAAVADSGVPLVLVGPRTERDPETARAFDALVSKPGVRWLGARPQRELPAYLGAAAVGLTPYRSSAFNRSSFPLKTLEYLAAGLAVVSSDLPSVAWLGTDLVSVGRTPEEFARATRCWTRSARDVGTAADRRAFAATHSWSARAAALDQFLRNRPAGRTPDLKWHATPGHGTGRAAQAGDGDR